MTLPYGRQSIDESDLAAVAEVLRGDWLTTGPTVSAFEEELSKLTGGHPAVTCTSGTAALHMAYAGAGIGKGDEVITTPMTFVATASCALLQGADVTFVDIDEATALIDPAAVEATAGERTKVIAAVDYAGQPCDYDALQATAQRVGALTLDDAAHAVGGFYKGRPVGDLADITTLSFFPTKNMTTAEGGAVIAKDPAIAQRAREFHNIGMIKDPNQLRTTGEGAWFYEVHEFGLNYRLSDMQCALGLAQLKRLAAFKQRRSEVFARYTKALADVDGVSTLTVRDDVDPAWHLYPVRIHDGRRREIFEGLHAAGILVQVNYIPVYWHPAFAELGYRRGMCPVAEQFYAEEISLPMFPGLTDDDVDRVVETVAKLLS